MLKNQELPMILKVAEKLPSTLRLSQILEQRENRRALVGICEFHQLYF